MKKSRREQTLKPVQQIEVSDKHVALRIVLVVLALLIAIGALTYGLTALLSVPTGWMQIESAATEINASADLTFYYYVGSEGRAAKTEKTEVTNAYSQACVNAYKLFETSVSADGNINAVNGKVNQEATVDAALYRALKTVSDYDVRLLLLAPIYERRANIFFAASDFEAMQFDPDFSADEKSFYNDILSFVNNPDDVSLEFLGDNVVRLNVSQRYADYASKNGVNCFIDFFHLKNAFIVDYVADYLTARNYTVGFVNSVDGFTRTLSGQNADNTLTLYDKVDGSPYACASVNFTGNLSAVNLHSFQIRIGENYYYEYSDGKTASPFLAPDGSFDTCSDFLFGHSDKSSCGEVLMGLLPLFMSDELDVDAVKELPQSGIDVIYAVNKTVYYTKQGLNMEVNQRDENIKYNKQLVG